MTRIIALDILKAAPQHAQDLGATGLAMLLAITTRWDSLGGTVSVRWSNRTMSDYSGLSRNTIPITRDRLVRLGWLTYQQEGLHAGRYVPHIPSYHVRASVVDHIQLHEIEPSTVQSLSQVPCNDSDKYRAITEPSTVPLVSQALGSYIPSPIPSPVPDPFSLTVASAPESVSGGKTARPREYFGPEIQTNTGKPWQLPLTTAKRHMTAYGYSEESLKYQLKRFANHKAELPQAKRPGVGGMHRVLESWLVKHAPDCAATELPIRAPRLSPDTLAACIEAQAKLDEQKCDKQDQTERKTA